MFTMELEIPHISMITDFEAGVKYIDSPSMITRFFSLSSVTVVCSFWQWGAIIIAIIATFSSIMKRIKGIHIRRLKSSSESLLHHLDIDLDLTDVDADDSSRVLSDNEDVEPAGTASSSDEYDDFLVKGSNFFYNSLGQNGGNLRFRCNYRGGERFGWSDFSSGKNVVKLWDSLGLSIGFDSFDDSSDSESVVSLWDLDQDMKINDLFGFSSHLPTVSAAATPSKPVILSSEMNDGRKGVVLEAYDTRMGSKKPAIYAEWGSPAEARKIVGVQLRGVEKVYVRNGAGGVVTVGDVRRLKTPLQTEADAVIAHGDDEFVDCSM